jgi:alkanesulfonate monooxygenase SsuD/methylene tetrahydromethanopterin reductase-like flavin-dependent oxidoreductase (luciferase family)
MAVSNAAFGSGSVSFRSYPHDLPAEQIVAIMRDQAVQAVAAGFDGVMTSEHHGGFTGYLPNPIQSSGWLLDAMPTGWAAPCPMLLPLRAPALVIEEVAWLAARFPGRVGLGVAAGSLEQDFSIMGLDKTDLTRRFADALATVAAALSGRDPGALIDDPAVRRCATHPVPVLSAAMSPTACRRAAANGVGLLIDSLASLERCRELSDCYRDAGGSAPVCLVRRVWVDSDDVAGSVTGRHEEQEQVYRSYAAAAAQTHWQASELISGGPEQVAEALVAARSAAGADALNLRVHVPGITADEVSQQLDALVPVVAAIRESA